MVRVVREGAQHHIDRGSFLATATLVVRNRHYPVDVCILVAVVERELRDRGNLLRFMARAHAPRHDQNAVTRAGAALATAMAHESAARGFGYVFGRRRVQTLGQISYDGHVVGHVGVSDLFAAAYA